MSIVVRNAVRTWKVNPSAKCLHALRPRRKKDFEDFVPISSTIYLGSISNGFWEITLCAKERKTKKKIIPFPDICTTKLSLMAATGKKGPLDEGPWMNFLFFSSSCRCFQHQWLRLSGEQFGKCQILILVKPFADNGCCIDHDEALLLLLLLLLPESENRKTFLPPVMRKEPGLLQKGRRRRSQSRESRCLIRPRDRTEFLPGGREGEEELPGAREAKRNQADSLFFFGGGGRGKGRFGQPVSAVEVHIFSIFSNI